MKTVSWFSCGISSAVATYLVLDEIDEIVYCHVDDQHEDTLRFLSDCEDWYKRKITVLQSPYKTVYNVCSSQRYINSPNGAPCSKFLKVRPRLEWEAKQTEPLLYVWGFDAGKQEEKRFSGVEKRNPQAQHKAPLIEQSIHKEISHEIAGKFGLKRPKMYDLGYPNNNCIGCVKASSMGYWNKIRVDFPGVFKARAEMEKEIGGTIFNGMPLNELDPEKGRNKPIKLKPCGLICQMTI